jgi:hypothetical protein
MRRKIYGTGNAPSATALQFISPSSGGGPWSTTETQFAGVGASGFLTNFRVNLTAAPGSGKSRSVTIRKNGVDQITVTVSDLATSNVTNAQVAVSPGDLISLSTQPSGSPASATVSWSMDFQGGAAGVTTTMAASNTSGTALGYIPPEANTNFGTSAPANELLVSEDGTFSNLYVTLGAVLGSGTRSFTLRKNGVNQSLTCTISAGGQSASDTLNSVSVAAGDRIVIVTGGSAVAITSVGVGMTFTPTRGEGYATICCGCPNSPSNSVANYQPIAGSAGSWLTTEAAAQIATTATLLKRLQVRLSTAPGLGNQWQFNVKVNGGYTGMEVLIADTATTGSVDIDVAVADGDLIALEAFPTSTPTLTGRFEWALTTYQLNPASGRSFGVLFN